MEIMERWDILNKDGGVTGRTVTRGEVRLNPGEYHLVVHIWVLGPDGRLLIQRRSRDKDLMPGEWAATGGAVIAGEDSLQAALRELKEEMSIAVPPEDMALVRRMIRKNSFVDVWLTRADADIASLTLQESEVSEARWVSPAELLDMIKSGAFHNYGHDYFETVLAAVRAAEATRSAPTLR